MTNIQKLIQKARLKLEEAQLELDRFMEEHTHTKTLAKDAKGAWSNVTSSMIFDTEEKIKKYQHLIDEQKACQQHISELQASLLPLVRPTILVVTGLGHNTLDPRDEEKAMNELALMGLLPISSNLNFHGRMIQDNQLNLLNHCSSVLMIVSNPFIRRLARDLEVPVFETLHDVSIFYNIREEPIQPPEFEIDRNKYYEAE